jgi:hypothetical protein
MNSVDREPINREVPIASTSPDVLEPTAPYFERRTTNDDRFAGEALAGNRGSRRIEPHLAIV